MDWTTDAAELTNAARKAGEFAAGCSWTPGRRSPVSYHLALRGCGRPLADYRRNNAERQEFRVVITADPERLRELLAPIASALDLRILHRSARQERASISTRGQKTPTIVSFPPFSHPPASYEPDLKAELESESPSESTPIIFWPVMSRCRGRRWSFRAFARAPGGLIH
jgi:hypothetical protein